MGALDFLVFLGILLLLFIFYKVIKVGQSVLNKIKNLFNKFSKKNQTYQS